MTPALAPATGLIFAVAGIGAIGTIVATVAPAWGRIVHLLHNEKTPADHWSTGVPSLRPIAGRRSAKVARSFPSQARRGVPYITVSPRRETVAVPDVAKAGR